MKVKYKCALITLLVIILTILLFRVEFIHDVFYIILVSFIIAYALKPLYRYMVKNGFNRRSSAAMLITLSFMLIVVSIIIIIPSLFKENANIGLSLNKIQSYAAYLYKRIKPLQTSKISGNIFNHLSQKTSSYILSLGNTFFEKIINLSSYMLAIFVIPFISYYFIIDGGYISNRFLAFIPCSSRSIIKKVFKDIDKLMSRYVAGQFLLSLIISIATLIILISYKVQLPLILSILNGIFNIIPYFGPFLGGVPIIIVAALKSPMTGVYVWLWLWVLQLIEGNLISPFITGESVSMHPLTVIILLIIGDEISGFWGMVLAIPVGVILKIFYEDLNYYLF